MSGARHAGGPARQASAPVTTRLFPLHTHGARGRATTLPTSRHKLTAPPLPPTPPSRSPHASRRKPGPHSLGDALSECAEGEALSAGRRRHPQARRLRRRSVCPRPARPPWGPQLLRPRSPSQGRLGVALGREAESPEGQQRGSSGRSRHCSPLSRSHDPSLRVGPVGPRPSALAPWDRVKTGPSVSQGDQRCTRDPEELTALSSRLAQ